MKYPSIFHLISAAFKERGAKCVLIGGFAVNFHKVSRATVDVDFLTSEEDFEVVYDLLEEEGFKKFSEQKTFVQLSSDKGYIKNLDFMFVDKDVLDRIIKDGCQAVIAKQKFVVPSLLHLIALKLHSIRGTKQREYKDLVDIIDLIRSNKVDIKSKKFKTLCLEYGTESIYDRIVKHFG